MPISMLLLEKIAAISLIGYRGLVQDNIGQWLELRGSIYGSPVQRVGQKLAINNMEKHKYSDNRDR